MLTCSAGSPTEGDHQIADCYEPAKGSELSWWPSRSLIIVIDYRARGKTGTLRTYLNLYLHLRLHLHLHLLYIRICIWLYLTSIVESICELRATFAGQR